MLWKQLGLDRVGLSLDVEEEFDQSIRNGVLQDDLSDYHMRDAGAALSYSIALDNGEIDRMFGEHGEHTPFSLIIDDGEFLDAYEELRDNREAPQDAHQPVPRFVHDLNLSGKVQRDAHELLSDADENDALYMGRRDKSYAAGAVYAAALLNNQKRDQSEVTHETGVADIRRPYQEVLHNSGRSPQTVDSPEDYNFADDI